MVENLILGFCISSMANNRPSFLALVILATLSSVTFIVLIFVLVSLNPITL